MEDALVDSDLDKFNELVQLANLGEDYFSNKTVFAPSNRALGSVQQSRLSSPSVGSVSLGLVNQGANLRFICAIL